MNNQLVNSATRSGSTPHAFVDIYRGSRLDGVLRIPDARLSGRLTQTHRRISWSNDHDDHWHDVSRFIQQRYHDAFDACIDVTFPELIWVCDRSGVIQAAAGVRSADPHALFLEQYLAHPIEETIGVARNRIVEIGNLVSIDKTATVVIFCALALVLERRGVTHAAATGTHLLEKRMKGLGLQMTQLCKATIAQLDGARDQWGRYYDSSPHVLVGSVPDCARHLRASLLVELGNPNLDKAALHRTRTNAYASQQGGYVQ